MTATTMQRPLRDSGVSLDHMGHLIERDDRIDEAVALCLLSIARSAERIATALEDLRDMEAAQFVETGGL